MTPTEQLRAFIERVKGEHVESNGLCGRCYGELPCDALRAVLALEELVAAIERFRTFAQPEVAKDDFAYDRLQANYQDSAGRALARAAQKIGGKGWSA